MKTCSNRGRAKASRAKEALLVAMLVVLPALSAQAQAQAGNKSDPLLRYQWHLMNYGQKVLGDTRPAFGVDLGIDDLHAYNIRGRGVIVGVLDQGVEIAHPDLAANMVPNGSKNFDVGAPERDPTPTTASASHGTAVAGIIAAVGWNGIGVRGVAPAARLKSFNGFGDTSRSLTGEKVAYAWWDGAETREMDISNNSWGATPRSPVLISENDIAAFERPMSATRQGRGVSYVKSAGNSFNSLSVGGYQACHAETRSANVGCTQTGFDPRNNFFNIITTAAVAASGKRSSYSSPGAALWVSGLGGEYGRERAYFTHTNPLVFDPAIVTTDLAGCVRGSNTNEAKDNALSGGQSRIDNTCDYDGTMNGTSAAAPTVSGVAALVMQANPRLGFREIKYVLAATAQKIDPAQPVAMHANGTVLVPGWTRNAAGHQFSNWYGYGLVDATRAVEFAGRLRPFPALVDTGWREASVEAPVAIGGAAAPGTLQVAIGDDISKIEGVQLGWATDYAITLPEDPKTIADVFGTRMPLQVVLVSPSGTRSHVIPAMTTIAGTTAFKVDFIASNAFLDEPAQGNWTLEIADVPLAAGAESQGRITGFKLRVLGR